MPREEEEKLESRSIEFSTRRHTIQIVSSRWIDDRFNRGKRHLSAVSRCFTLFGSLRGGENDIER